MKDQHMRSLSAPAATQTFGRSNRQQLEHFFFPPLSSLLKGDLAVGQIFLQNKGGITLTHLLLLCPTVAKKPTWQGKGVLF